MIFLYQALSIFPQDLLAEYYRFVQLTMHGLIIHVLHFFIQNLGGFLLIIIKNSCIIFKIVVKNFIKTIFSKFVLKIIFFLTNLRYF